MAKKKIFTDISLKTLIDEIKAYVNNLMSKKADLNHTHTISNITNLQTTLDGKAASSHNHSTSNITSGTLSTDRLPTIPISKGGTGATTAAGVLTNLGIAATSTELNYCDGVTSNIQTQLNGKSATSHTHNYAGSSSAGGSATLSDAVKGVYDTNGGKRAPNAIGANKVNFHMGNEAGNGYQDWIHMNCYGWADVPYATMIGVTKAATPSAYIASGGNSSDKSAWTIYKLLDSHNYTDYTPTKTGSGASSTWGINITGSASTATTATKLANDRTIFGKTFNGSGNVAGQPLVYGTYTDTASSRYSKCGLQIRENDMVGSAQSDIGYAPSIGFHWGGKIAASMLFHSDGNFYLRKQDGVTRASLDANLIGNASTATNATNATNANNAATATTLTGLTATVSELNYVDGVTANIQTQLNGKSSTSHTHNYAGSSSAGGNANAAVKLVTSRNIGKASFDGTANIDAQSICGYANCTGTTDANANKYTKFARVTLSGAYSQCVGTLLFTPNEGNSISGALNYYLRNGSAITSTTINLYWQHLTNLNYEQSVVAVTVSDGVFDLYYKALSNWDTMKIININCNNPDRITFVSNSGWVASVTAASTSSINSNVSYAKSAGSATTATQLSSSAGSATQPVYFSGGKPVATTYTLGKSVPSDAKFTDTNTWRGIQNNLTSTSTTDSLSAAQGTALKALVDGKAASNHTHSYLPLSGGTLTGAVTFANSTWNTVGDDAQLGDCNIAGCIGIKGKNANTGINFVPYSGSTAQKLTIDGAGTMTITGTVASTFSGSLSGNATSATKLQTARTIALGTGATGTATSFNGSTNITIPVTDVKEAYLSWGGKNFSSGYGCIDGAMIQDLSANRLAFAKASGITIEYSRDSGATWTDYGSSNVAKSSLFTSNGYAHLIGKADSTNKATSAYQLRVTLNAPSGGIYTALNKFCLYVSTNGSSGTTCTIQIAKNSAPSTYTTIVNEQGIGGWSGYNIINVNPFTFGSNSDQYGNLRFIFKSTGGSTQYNGLQIMSIQGFGGVGWSTPSNMAKTGHIYSFDGNQNVTFPASITGTGTLSMNRKSGTTVGSYSVALGYNNESSNQYTFAEGVDTKATDYAAHAEGDRTTSSSTGSHAEGQSTVASGLQAHAEGRGSTASGSTSHAEGMGTTASATGAHSEGSGTKAEGMNCHAEGASTVAKGFQTHAEGNGTTSSGSSSHAEGDKTTASGFGSHSEGVSTNKSESITTSIVNSDIITAWGTGKFSLAKGEGSHVEGKNCIALESYSHAEGHGTTASGLYGSHAEGDETVASGQSSHAEGSDTVASGLEAHAEGNGCVASGSYSHAEGKSTTASGIYSHAQNLGTVASAFYSTAMGEYTKASSLAQTVMGKYNVEDTSDTYAFIIGNGDSDSERSNALTVDWSGNEWLAGGLTVDGQFKYKAGTTTTLKPYYTKGDSFTMTALQTAGYLTNSNKEVHFTIPIDRPLIGVSTVTISSVNGFILRQENKYTHGSAASTRVKPTSYGAAHYYASHIHAVANFTTTTNSINNSAIGIDANIKVTFS